MKKTIAPKWSLQGTSHQNIVQQTSATKVFLCFLFIAAGIFNSSAQKAVVLNAFSKHQIDTNILNPDYLQQTTSMAFDYKQSLTAAGKETVTLAKFDPSKPKDEQWTVLNIDGKSPSKSEINTFRKNQQKPASTSKADDATYKIEKETADYLVISYKADAASLTKDASFMKDCRMSITINLKTKRVEKTQVINEKPVKVKILTADVFDMTIQYNWNEQTKRYFIVSENLNMQAKFMGQAADVRTLTTYTNFSIK